MLLLALQWGGVGYAWGLSVVVGLLVAFNLMFITFLGSQWYAGDSALIPHRLFQYRTVILAFGACLIAPGGSQPSSIIYPSGSKQSRVNHRFLVGSSIYQALYLMY